MTILHRAHDLLQLLTGGQPIPVDGELTWGLDPAPHVAHALDLHRRQVRRRSGGRVMLVPLHEPLNIPPPWRPRLTPAARP